MDPLIETNACNALVDKELKTDPRGYCRMKLNHSMAVIVRKNKTKLDLAQFHHGSCSSPVRSTFICAINNNYFIKWPGLDKGIVIKHLPGEIATGKGHMNQEKQVLQSTKHARLTTDQNSDILKRLDTIIKRLHLGNRYRKQLKTTSIMIILLHHLRPTSKPTMSSSALWKHHLIV